MAGREVSIVIFHDTDGNIGVQERGSHSKLGEKYGYFGGGVETNETPEIAMRRELEEELGYVPDILEFWTDHSFYITKDEYKNWLIKCHVFLSPITPRLLEIKVIEGERVVKMHIDEAIVDKGFYSGDKELLQKLKSEFVRRKIAFNVDI